MNRKEIAEFIGLGAIVASLVFVGLELRQSQNIGLAEGYSAIFTARREASNSIKEHVDLWRRGTTGEELNERDAAIFAILLNQLNEAAAQAYLYKERVAGTDVAQIDAQDFAGFLYHNPGARSVWNEREEDLGAVRRLLVNDSTYDNAWTVAVRSYLDELDQGQLQIDQKPFVDW